MRPFMEGNRYLLVIADDFGIGPGTTQGILELSRDQRVTGTVLMVTSPWAEDAVRAWRASGASLEVGWHPCLNLDQPILPPERVPSLVDRDGNFLPLERFIARAVLGRLHKNEVRAELRAQYDRFQELVGQPPAVVNTHKHIQVFDPVGSCLLEVLQEQRPLSYVRRVTEPWRSLAGVPGARCKRAFLTWQGRRFLRKQAGFPGNDCLAGVTNPDCVADPDFLVRWLNRVPGRVVELACHPGDLDHTLAGRDCPPHELSRRTRERDLLRHPSFLDAVRQAGFTLVSASELGRRQRIGHQAA